jgi:threonine/homoserine/homoserine lactone efflux protein
MDQHLLLGLVAFAFVSSITPGPNNMMLMASGANFGVRRTVPHMLGVALGFGLMVALVGIGLIGLFDLWPPSHAIIKWTGVAYMIWLAFKIARAGPPVAAASARGRPLGFFQAAAFQWVNPKAWTMALGAIAAYAPGHDLGAVLLVAGVFAVINLPSVGTWAVLGQGLRGWLGDPGRLRLFNYGMAALLIASLWPVVSG